MGIETDSYSSPTSWDEIDSTWIENGDCAGWVDAIRAAMMERVEVCINGIWGGSQLQSLVNGLGYFQRSNYSNNPTGYRGDCEVYEFAKETEIILDTLLTPYLEYGTINNGINPNSERGYFVDQEPANWLKRVDYPSELSETGTRTTLYAKFLNMETLFEDDECNYQLALSGVARGDTPSKFVPFFHAVKKTLNRMTVIPCAIRSSRASVTRYVSWDENVSVVENNMLSVYNDYMGDFVKKEHLYNEVFSNSLINISRIENVADVSASHDQFYGYFLWGHRFPFQVTTKLPPIEFDLYRAHWAEKLTISNADSNQFGWSGGEYTAGHDLIAHVTGYGHFVGGDDSKTFGSKFPADSLMFPTTPERDKTNIIGYELHYFHFADFNVSGGFRFRDSGA